MKLKKKRSFIVFIAGLFLLSTGEAFEKNAIAPLSCVPTCVGTSAHFRSKNTETLYSFGWAPFRFGDFP